MSTLGEIKVQIYSPEVATLRVVPLRDPPPSPFHFYIFSREMFYDFQKKKSEMGHFLTRGNFYNEGWRDRGKVHFYLPYTSKNTEEIFLNNTDLLVNDFKPSPTKTMSFFLYRTKRRRGIFSIFFAELHNFLNTFFSEKLGNIYYG